MFSFPVRKIPVVQPYVFALSWVTRGKTYQKFYRHQKRVCWITSRGRAVTRLTGLTRCQFRGLALSGWCHGLQRASW